MRAFLPLLAFVAAPALAVQPDEVLDDPVLEDRARDLSGELRCLVCRNESIDESSADIARDLRLLVRERLSAGDTDREVIDYVVARYGEYVLLRPSTDGVNMVLWAAPLALLLVGGGVAVAHVRGQRRGATEALTPEEEARLAQLVDDPDRTG